MDIRYSWKCVWGAVVEDSYLFRHLYGVLVGGELLNHVVIGRRYVIGRRLAQVGKSAVSPLVMKII